MDILRRCSEILESGQSACLVTVLKATSGSPGKPGFKLVLAEDGSLEGSVGGGTLEHRAIEEAQQALERRENQLLQLDLGQLGMLCGGEVTLIVEYLQPGKRFALFGGGHIGRALCPILESLGFRVTIWDSRQEVGEALGGESDRTIIVRDYSDFANAKETLVTADYCFIATHAHQHDYAVLKALLTFSRNYRYIGLIGSQREITTSFRRLVAEGLTIPDCLYAPVGLSIGAKTASEIAVSIAAEIVAVMKDHPVEHMRLSPSQLRSADSTTLS